jgi:1-acyl-sn-glycerol-3-phosphate acyltransferase
VKKKVSIHYAPPIVIDAARYISLAASKILWRIKYHDRENIPRGLKSGLVVVANHQTYFDPFWICAPMKRKYRFMAWDKAFEWFLVGWLIRYLGSFPVDTKHGSGTKKVWRETLNALQDGATVLIFPEAVRELSDGQMFEFKTGAVRLAMEAGVPILPVTVRGGNKIWAQGMKYPRLGKVEVFYHPLFEVEKTSEKEDLRQHLEDLTAQIAAIIGSKLPAAD